MQYHTKQSLAIAERNHKLYETARISTDAAEKMALETQMINSYDDFILPDGADILFPDLK